MMTDIGHGILMQKDLVDKQKEPDTRPRFIAVVHGRHVHCNGFNVHQLQARDAEAADKEACYLMHRREKPFDSCSYVLVQIDSTEQYQRKLTWRERITGRLS